MFKNFQKGNNINIRKRGENKMKKFNTTGSCWSQLINGIEIIYSYQTPIAYRANGETVATQQKYSVTTSKHMGKYVGNRREVPDMEFRKELRLLTGTN
jgi:hypothetical protein